MKKNEKEKKLQIDTLKYEIAEELGLMEKLHKVGWQGLSARETGKIGGLISSKRKKEK